MKLLIKRQKATSSKDHQPHKKGGSKNDLLGAELKMHGPIAEVNDESGSASQPLVKPDEHEVAYSESEGEEYIEIGQVRALDLDEVRVISEKF